MQFFWPPILSYLCFSFWQCCIELSANICWYVTSAEFGMAKENDFKNAYQLKSALFHALTVLSLGVNYAIGLARG